MMVPIISHMTFPPDKVVVGASALSLALDVSISRVRKIKENIANHISALRDVFVPLAEPLSVMALTCTKDDYEVIGMNDQAAADEKAAGNAEPFPSVEDAELNIP
ncbi:hypothetical protein Tco_0959409 [Tanacetum coccineum]